MTLRNFEANSESGVSLSSVEKRVYKEHCNSDGKHGTKFEHGLTCIHNLN